MLNQLVRYLPVVEALSAQSGPKLLDVGCGFLGIGPYISDRYVGCDLLLCPHLPPFGKPHPRMLPVAGSALQLPFPDDAFDVVISMDMLEHIPPAQRENVIKELHRVAICTVILGFPEGAHNIRWEIRTAKWYRLMGKPVPEWLEEHFEHGLPTPEAITAILDAKDIAYDVRPNVNCAVHFVINLIECSFLEPTVSAASRIVMQSEWNAADHGWRANLIRRLGRKFLPVLKCLNFGKTVRRIYRLRKSPPGPARAEPVDSVQNHQK